MIYPDHDHPKIKNYEITLTPFLMQMSVGGTFEVETPYEIPDQSLFARINLPDQVLQNVEMVPNEQKFCTAKGKKCRVFEFKTFFRFAADQYFAREFYVPEYIPIKIFFELKTANETAFWSLNPSVKKNFLKYIAFINDWKLITLENGFRYRNAFNIHRNKYGPSGKSIDVPVK